VRALVEGARRLILRLVPEARERLRAGWGLLGYDAPRYFAYVAAAPDHARIGFERGVLLADPAGLLRGTGTQVRHVEIRAARDLRSRALAALVREAAGLRQVPPGRSAPGRAGPGHRAKRRRKAKRR
jgi:hypothetical protein